MSKMNPRNETGTERSGQLPDALEVALATALRRVDAPEGFAERVLASMAAAPTPSAAAPADRAVSKAPPRLPHRLPDRLPNRLPEMRWPALHGRAWLGGAIAAVLLLGAFGAEQQQHRRLQRERSELATRQFEAALRVTDQALRQTRRQTRRQLRQAGLNFAD